MDRKLISLLIALLFFFGGIAHSQEDQPEEAAQQETAEQETEGETDIQIPKAPNNWVYEKENIQGKRPVPYPYVREADVMWSKVIWRVIDLRQKMNHPLFFPTEPMEGRTSLFNLLMTGIKNGEIMAYEPNEDGDFKTPIGYDQVRANFDAGVVTQEIPDPETGGTREVTVEKEVNPAEVKQLILKEQWFFDKKYSTMKVRIIGICPVRFWEETDDLGDVRTQKRRAFWIYFPEARKLLARHELFNPNNDAQPISFDDLFFKRMFESFIQKESNVYNNRLISEYTTGLNSMLESRQIKYKIFEMEHDLWEY